MKDTYWLKGWDADDFFEKLCASKGIGLSLPDPAEFTKRLQEVIPDRARRLGTTLQDVGSSPRVPVSETAGSGTKEQEASATSSEYGSSPVEAARPPELAAELRDAKTPDEAIAVCKELAERDPKSSEAFLRWAMALSQLGRCEEALEKYKRAMEIDPKFSVAFCNWGSLLQELGGHEEAIEKYKRATEIDHKSAWTFSSLADLLQDLNKHEEAIEKLRRATEIKPGTPGRFPGGAVR